MASIYITILFLKFISYMNDIMDYGWGSSLMLDFAKLGASLALAALSWKYIEQPVLALKGRFGYPAAASSGLEVRPKVDELQGAGAG
jgi:peptidoglycan/LPS O-acetylase OafA/YrhL